MGKPLTHLLRMGLILTFVLVVVWALRAGATSGAPSRLRIGAACDVRGCDLTVNNDGPWTVQPDLAHALVDGRTVRATGPAQIAAGGVGFYRLFAPAGDNVVMGAVIDLVFGVPATGGRQRAQVVVTLS
jgi:hypothetical protein